MQFKMQTNAILSFFSQSEAGVLSRLTQKMVFKHCANSTQPHWGDKPECKLIIRLGLYTIY